jgi:hypothetical protein
LDGNNCKHDGAKALRFGEFFMEVNPPLSTCAKASLANPTWELDHFKFTAYNNFDGELQSFPELLMTMPLLDTSIDCAATGDKPAGFGAWNKAKPVDCSLRDFIETVPHPPTTIKFDEDTSIVEIEQTWKCTDGANGPYVSQTWSPGVLKSANHNTLAALLSKVLPAPRFLILVETPRPRVVTATSMLPCIQR